jgi:small-conductance mechanosensitive channel
MLEEFPFLSEALDSPYVRAALLVAGSLLVAKIADLVICGLVLRMARKTESDLDDRVIRTLHRPVFLTVVFFGLYLATEVLGLPDEYDFWTRGLILTLGILVWMVALTRIAITLLEAVSRRVGRAAWIDARTAPLLQNVAKIVIFGAAVYAFLMVWNLDVKPLLASAGIVGIALGFAAKDTLANLFSGIFILADAPYKIGDWIVLDSGERGEVVAIGLRSTRLLTRDDVEVTLPNAVIANAKIANESGGPSEKARVTVHVGVAYGSDVDRVREVLLEAATSVADITRDPAPRVRFTAFGESSLDFRLLCWVERPVERGRCLDELNTAVYKMFAASGIEIPFPQRVVHLPAGDAPPTT